MRKIIIFTVILFSLPVVLLSQSISVSDTNRINNYLYADVDVYSASVSYKKRIAKKWKVGLSVGYGFSSKPVLNSLFIGDYEVFHIGIPFEYKLVKIMHFDIEPRYAYLIDKDWNNEKTIGVGINFFIGGKIIQYGVKTMFGRTTFSDPDYFVSSTYLVLRFSVFKG